MDARVFVAVHFLKVHDDSYTFTARPAYIGYLAHVMSKFVEWRKLFVLVRRQGLCASTTPGVRVAGLQ